MPKNKQEDTIFTMLMAGFMVICMCTFNAIMHFGMHSELPIVILKSLVPTYVVALFVNMFIVKKIAMTIANNISKNNPKMKGILIPLCMVTGMSLIMCVWGTFVIGNVQGNPLQAYLHNWICSFIVALTLQLTIAQKLVKKIFSYIINRNYQNA